MNFNFEMFQALIQIVKTGGFYGIVGLSIWIIFQCIKTAFLGVLSFKMIKELGIIITNLYLMRKALRRETISLLSEESTSILQQSLKSYQEESTKLTQELLQQVQDLKKKSKAKKTE